MLIKTTCTCLDKLHGRIWHNNRWDNRWTACCTGLYSCPQLHHTKAHTGSVKDQEKRVCVVHCWLSSHLVCSCGPPNERKASSHYKQSLPWSCTEPVQLQSGHHEQDVRRPLPSTLTLLMLQPEQTVKRKQTTEEMMHASQLSACSERQHHCHTSAVIP